MTLSRALPAAFWALVALIVVASLAPGWPLEAPAAMAEKLRTRFLGIDGSWFLPTVLERGLLFFPLGGLTVLYFGKSGVSKRRMFFGLLLFCFLVEASQLFIAGRHPRLFDLSIASFAAVLGGGVCLWAQAGGSAARRAAGAAAGGISLLLCLSGIALQDGVSLRTWSCAAPLLVGNERTLTRPWAGEIESLTLSASDGEVAAYDFATGLPDATVGPPMADLGGVLAAEDFAGACARLRDGGAFAIAAVVTPATNDQRGPARIVSQSRDTRNGNLLLGQEDARLVFRIATPSTGPYGAQRAVKTPPVLRPGRAHRVVAQYQRGRVRIAVDGVAVTEVHLARALWLGAPWETRFAWVALPLLIGAGALAAIAAGPGRGLRRALFIGTFPLVLTTLALSVFAGYLFDPALLAVAVIGPAAGAVLLRRF